MLRRSLVPIVVAVMALGAVSACASKETPPSAASTGPQFPASGASTPGPSSPGGPALPTAPGGPPSTFKTTEPCNALYRFQQAGFNTGMAEKDKQAALYEATVKGGADLKAQVPQLAADVDLTLVLLKKAVDGTIGPSDQADQTKAAAGLEAYWKTNCL